MHQGSNVLSGGPRPPRSRPPGTTTRGARCQLGENCKPDRDTVWSRVALSPQPAGIKVLMVYSCRVEAQSPTVQNQLTGDAACCRPPDCLVYGLTANDGSICTACGK